MIKRLVTIILFLTVIHSGTAFALELPNLGLFPGTSYYLGDINPTRHFYHPSISLGVIYRYNLNTRYALKGNVYFVQLSGSDLDFPEILHPDRQYSPVMFNTSLIDIALQVEYNFLPFMPYHGN